ncbi:secretogranin-3 [Brienomyrus brachyistius]|uniref:secretogranin-3 n=1 Tax=Brienomyrus brachyistius TaxID=42636 RepID=UPI0020B456AF|nr:secretogranin-3 [Brienomyrus brachyistius]
MASKSTEFLIIAYIFTITVYHVCSFPTPALSNVHTVYNRELSEERPLEEQIAEADSVSKAKPIEKTRRSDSTEPRIDPDNNNFSTVRSTAEKTKNLEKANPRAFDGQHFTEDADSTKSRGPADDYDSTKNGMDYRFRDDPESFRQLDGTPLTAEDIVQKIANKIYEEDDRGVFDRIVSKLLKLGLITESQANTLEYEVAEALQDLITKNAKKNEVDDISMEFPISRTNDMEQSQDLKETARKDIGVEVEKESGVAEPGEQGRDDTVDGVRIPRRKSELRSEMSTMDGLDDLQYFPNFYSLLKSLSSEKDAQERETLITIMKTLIDFVKMMVKYGTITPEEGVSYLENLDAMIALQTKNKLGKSLAADIKPPTERSGDEVDNTKEATARMQKEYELLKDSTKDSQGVVETGHPGKSEIYLEAIRKNIEWLKKHKKDTNKEDYDLSKLRDFMDQQVDTYVDNGILQKDEGEVIKRIYSSM